MLTSTFTFSILLVSFQVLISDRTALYAKAGICQISVRQDAILSYVETWRGSCTHQCINANAARLTAVLTENNQP